MRMKRVKIAVHGDVHGVFFRASTRDKALDLGLKGYAKNMPDGTVEVVAEGPEDKLKELIAFCKNNPGYSNVSKVTVKEEEATNEFDGFRIGY